VCIAPAATFWWPRLRPPAAVSAGARSRVHSFERMERMVPQLEPLAAQARFAEIHCGEAPPWVRYVHTVKVAGRRVRAIQTGAARMWGHHALVVLGTRFAGPKLVWRQARSLLQGELDCGSRRSFLCSW
jgi:hypothetical protein